jgi:hypothetical protein
MIELVVAGRRLVGVCLSFRAACLYQREVAVIERSRQLRRPCFREEDVRGGLVQAGKRVHLDGRDAWSPFSDLRLGMANIAGW